MDQKSIILISCGHFEKDVLHQISKMLAREFQLPLNIHECSLDISKYYNPGRRQYDANGILQIISSISASPAVKTMGLLRVDLFIPILTYIYGQAFLSGNTGIASLYRLRNELYGLEPDNSLLIERFKKVILHEMGHMFGLIHCYQPECIMRSSTYVEDLDQKKEKFCIKCSQHISDVL